MTTKTKEKKHSPLPWTMNAISEGMTTKADYMKFCEDIWDKTPEGERRPIRVITTGETPNHKNICIFGPGPTNEENAAFIVEAVNNYASLRSQNETLRRDNEAMARCLESMKDAGFSFSLAVNAAIANALATLEEKS